MTITRKNHSTQTKVKVVLEALKAEYYTILIPDCQSKFLEGVWSG